MEDRGPWEKKERLSAKEPPEWQAREKKPPKLPDTEWDEKRAEPTLPQPRRPSPSYRPPPPPPRWGLRLLVLAVAAALGGLGAQYGYDHGLTGLIDSFVAFVQSILKPFSSCQEGYWTRCVD